MLIYHPGFDAYHSMFRMIAVIENVRDLEIDKARILEFFLLFPSAIAHVRIPPNSGPIRAEAKKFANPYRDPINLRTTFREMRFIQDAAIKCIAATDLIDKERFKQGFLTRTRKELPSRLKSALDEFIKERQPVSDYILGALAEFSLYGVNGLKDRTNLMEYRYDYID